MPTGFAVCPAVTVANYRPGIPGVQPYVLVTYGAEIAADAGGFSSIPLPANGTPPVGQFWMKIRASAATLTTIRGDAQVIGFAASRIADSLSTLTQQQKNRVNSWLLSMRYIQAEIDAVFGGNIGSGTVRDLIVFSAQRRTPFTVVDAATVSWANADIAQDSAVAADFIDTAV